MINSQILGKIISYVFLFLLLYGNIMRQECKFDTPLPISWHTEDTQAINQLQLALGESTGIVCGESLHNSQDWKDADIRSVI